MILPSLNKPAAITLESLNLNNPLILKDGNSCSATECEIISNSGDLIFIVAGFSVYSAVEMPQPPPSPGPGPTTPPTPPVVPPAQTPPPGPPPTPPTPPGPTPTPPPALPITIQVNESQFSAGVLLEVSEGDSLNITYSGLAYIITFESRFGNTIYLIINEQREDFSEGTEKRFDLNGDMVEDIVVRLDGIVEGQASIYTMAIKTPEPPPAVNQVWIIILALAAAAVILIFSRKDGKKEVFNP